MPIRADNDNAKIAAGSRYGASGKALFMPSAACAALFAIFLLWMEIRGTGNHIFARIALAMLLTCLPVSVANGILRQLTISVQPMAYGLLLQKGFPWRKPVTAPWLAIANIRIRQGIAGKFFRSGTLVCELSGGRKIAVRDLENVEQAKAEIERLLKRYRSGEGEFAGNERFHPPAAAG